MIHTRAEGPVRIISLNDPSTLNSLSCEMGSLLSAELTAATDDKDVRAVVITGEGRFFCTGGNLKGLAEIDGEPGAYVGEILEEIYKPLAEQMAALPVPIVIAMNGPALGAGVGLALNSDIILGAPNCYFSLPFVPKLGIVPDFGTAWLLMRSLGYQQALALSLSGERFTAEQALNRGVIFQLLEQEKLLDSAVVLANKLAGLPRHAVARTRRLLREASVMELNEHLKLERMLQIDCFREASFSEGIAAFMEKRPPDFSTLD